MQIIRRMRGESCPYLVKASDNRFYVAQLGGLLGDRAFINEWLGYCLFRRFNVSTPALHLLHFSDDVSTTARNPHSEIPGQIAVIWPGIYCGSQYPVDPTITAVYDFLPRKFLSNVVNLTDFAKAYVLDQLLGNTSVRQAVFARDRLTGGKGQFRAYFVGHGQILGGTAWEITKSSPCGLYWDQYVYSLIDMPALCEQYLRLVSTITEGELLAVVEEIPSQWFAKGEYTALMNLLRLVYERITNLSDLIPQRLEEFGLASNINLGPTQKRTIKRWNTPYLNTSLQHVTC